MKIIEMKQVDLVKKLDNRGVILLGNIQTFIITDYDPCIR